MPFARPEKFGILFTLRFMLRVLVSYNRNQERKTKETVYSPFEREKKQQSPWNIWFVCVRRGCGMWFFEQIFFFSVVVLNTFPFYFDKIASVTLETTRYPEGNSIRSHSCYFFFLSFCWTTSLIFLFDQNRIEQPSPWIQVSIVGTDRVPLRREMESVGFTFCVIDHHPRFVK